MSEVLGFDILTLDHSDCPDIQDFKHNIGIEVVEDVYEKERELEKFWEKYENVPLIHIPSKQIEGYYKRGGTLTTDSEKLTGGTLGEAKPNSPDHLISKILDKIQKLNSGKYVSFPINYLYVFVNTVSLFDSYIFTMIDEINKTEAKIKYQKIILDGYYELCFCDMERRSFERYDIPVSLRDYISKKAKETLVNE